MDTMLNKPEKAAARTGGALAGKTASARNTSAAAGERPAVMATNLTRTSLKAPDRDAGEDRFRLIAERAYFRAEKRGFTPGRELDDWLAAEIEVDEMLGSIETRT